MRTCHFARLWLGLGREESTKRMKQFVLDYLAAQSLKARNIVDHQRDLNDADLRLVLDDGQVITVYIINRALRVPEIRQRFEENTALNLHTLFIVDGRMLPQDSAEIDPPHWMSALHSVMDGRIYAYWCEGRDVVLRPVHLEWRWGGGPRTVKYGPALDLSDLRAEIKFCSSKYLTGEYAAADLGEGTFWKKRENIDPRQYKYSWRQWSYASSSRRQQQTDEQPDWDPWEEFVRNYGEVPGNDEEEFAGFRREAHQQRGNQGYGQNRRAQRAARSATYQHYAILGVPVTASFDEVKRAYRRKAREYHPDMHPAEKDKYTAKMANINAAFEAISKQLK